MDVNKIVRMTAQKYKGSTVAGIEFGAAESHSGRPWWFRPDGTVGADAADASFDRRPPIGRSRRRSFAHRQAPLFSTAIDMLLLLILLPVAWGAPNILLRLSQSGLQQSEQYARRLLDREIPRIRVPPFIAAFDDGPGHGKATVTKVTAKHFTAPLIKFRPSADGLLHLSTAWGKAEVDADFDAKYQVLSLVPVPFDGRITAKAEGLMSNIAVRIEVDHHIPKFTVVQCSAKIQSLELSLSGGLVANVIDLFKGALSHRISAALEQEFCRGAETTFVDFFRDRLTDILKDVPLSKNPNVLLVFSLQQVQISEEKVDVFVEAVVDWEGTRFTPTSTTGNEPFPVGQVSKSRRMIDLYVKEGVFQSALSGAHFSGYFDKNVGENNTFLQTTCEGLCIGAFAPALERAYPDRQLVLHVATTEAPLVKLATRKASVLLNGQVAAYLLPRNAKDEAIVEANMSAEVVVNLAVRKNNLTAWVEIENANMMMTNSAVGEIDESTLDFIVDLTVPFLEDVTDIYLKRGTLLPAPFDWQYDNSKLTIVENAVRFEADILVYV